MTYVALIEGAALFLGVLYLYADTSRRRDQREWLRERAHLIDAITQNRPMVAAMPEPEPEDVPVYTFTPEQEPDFSLVPE